MKIAIDAMGGDNGHEVNVEGACLAIDEFPSLEKLYLVGDENQITNSLKRLNTNNSKISKKTKKEEEEKKGKRKKRQKQR